MRSHIGHTHTEDGRERGERERRGGERERSNRKRNRGGERSERETEEMERQRERERQREPSGLLIFSSLIRTLIPTWQGVGQLPSRSHPNPITPQRSHLQMLSQWGLGCQYMNSGDETNSQSVTSRQSSF